jgi:mono/diheme cytochrome c family protein
MSLTLGRWTAGCFSAASVFGLLVATLLVVPTGNAEDKPKKRRGPPPIVYTDFPNVCARCHKSDGRGGPAYGGLAKDLRETELDHEALVYIIEEGIRDRGMPEFKSVLTKREINGLATYIVERIKGVYFDGDGNRITPEEAAALKREANAATN